MTASQNGLPFQRGEVKNLEKTVPIPRYDVIALWVVREAIVRTVIGSKGRYFTVTSATPYFTFSVPAYGYYCETILT